MSEDAAGRFTTYAHYLRAIAALAGSPHPAILSASTYPSLVGRISAESPFCKLRVQAGVDVGAVKRSLTNAWGTELLLCLGGQYATEDELLRVTNNWAAVQLYYVFYHATQALYVARGNERPESHPMTQKIFMDTWVSRPGICLPWGLGFGPEPCNLPGGHVYSDKVTTVARPRGQSDYVNYLLKGIATTRAEAIPDIERNRWREKKAEKQKAWQKVEDARLLRNLKPKVRPPFATPLLTPEEKTKSRSSLRRYTIMDLLFRLRIKTHYRDGLMFIDGPQDSSSSGEVNADMRYIAGATLLRHELYVGVLLALLR